MTFGNPVLDWASTAQWWGLDWAEFQELSGEAQSFRVAVYRTNRQIDAVLAFEQNRKAKARARRNAKRKK